MTESVPPRVPDLEKIQFRVVVEPREIARKQKGALHVGIEIVYDLKVHDEHNNNLLVFSNQGYENREDAVALALKLFRGRPALLHTYDGDGFLQNLYDLRTYTGEGKTSA